MLYVRGLPFVAKFLRLPIALRKIDRGDELSEVHSRGGYKPPVRNPSNDPKMHEGGTLGRTLPPFFVIREIHDLEGKPVSEDARMLLETHQR